MSSPFDILNKKSEYHPRTNEEPSKGCAGGRIIRFPANWTQYNRGSAGSRKVPGFNPREYKPEDWIVPDSIVKEVRVCRPLDRVTTPDLGPDAGEE